MVNFQNSDQFFYPLFSMFLYIMVDCQMLEYLKYGPSGLTDYSKLYSLSQIDNHLHYYSFLMIRAYNHYHYSEKSKIDRYNPPQVAM